MRIAERERTLRPLRAEATIERAATRERLAVRLGLDEDEIRAACHARTALPPGRRTRGATMSDGWISIRGAAPPARPSIVS